MSSTPSIRKLQYTLAVARELHFRKAAERLRVAQPSISRQVRECEEEVGFQILERDHHFVSLTQAGRLFVQEVDEILKRFGNDLEQAILRGQAMSRQASSECIIAHSPFASLRVRRIVLELRKGSLRHFDVRLRILSTNEIIRAIEGGTIRAGLTFGPINFSGLSAIPIGLERWLLAVPARSRLANLHAVSIGDLRGAALISAGANHTHPELVRRLVAESDGSKFQFVAEASSPSEAFDLVRTGHGVCLLPEEVCEHLPEGVTTLHVGDIAPLERILVHRPQDEEFATTLAGNIALEIGRQDGVLVKKEVVSTYSARSEARPSKRNRTLTTVMSATPKKLDD
jgi:DNA-binding transcriptional LysR family regulator